MLRCFADAKPRSTPRAVPFEALLCRAPQGEVFLLNSATDSDIVAVMISRRGFVMAGVSAIIAPRLTVAQDTEGTVILIAEKGQMPLLGNTGTATDVWRFDQKQPIAVLRAKQGQEFKVRFINRLDEEVWLHWFGVRGNTEAMTLNVAPGEANAVDIKFTPPDAGTFWFGPLIHASQQRDMGLYGMLIVEEAAPQNFNDVPLIFDDWKIVESGAMEQGFGDLQAAIGEGRLGNWFTLNGSFKSHIKIDRARPSRLRLLNAANVRTMNILFKGAELYLMALDGQPVPLKPLGQEALRLSPGQRADLLLSTIKSQIVVSLDLLEDVAEVGFLDPVGSAGSLELPDNFMLPRNPLAKLGDLSLAKAFTILIEGGAKGGLKSAIVGDERLDIRTLLERGLAWALNGVAGPGGSPLFEVPLGESMVLTLDNRTSFPQPLHIHGHVWQMIEAEGQTLEGEPWRDTAIVPGLSKIKMALVADNVGLWAIQSLLAERVDSGLLGAFAVVPAQP